MTKDEEEILRILKAAGKAAAHIPRDLLDAGARKLAEMKEAYERAQEAKAKAIEASRQKTDWDVT